VGQRDTIEDTDVTAKYLLFEGIPTEVVHAVNLLSKQHNEPPLTLRDRIVLPPNTSEARVEKIRALADVVDSRTVTYI
jgi:hypothetical protein